MILASLLALAGCVPHVVWVGQTDRHDVVILRAGEIESLVVDKRSLGRWRYVADTTLTAAGGHLAWAARTDEGWVAFRDGEAGATWDGIGEVVLDAGGDHLAYTAAREGGWHVVVDEQVQGPFDAVFAGTLTLGDDGRWAAVVGQEERARVVADGVPGPPFDAVGRLGWAGDEVVYAGRRGGDWWVVDGAGPVEAGGALLDLAACGPRRAWAVGETEGDRVVAGEERWTAAASMVEGSLTFDAACEHVLWTEAAGGTRTLRRDGEDVASGEAVSAPVFSEPDRWGVIVHEGVEATVVIDGEAVARAPSAVGLALSDGGRWAFVSWSGEGTWVVTESGRFGPHDEVVPGTLAFAGDRWVWVAGQRRGHRWLVADPSGEVAPLDLERWSLAHRHLPPSDPASEDFSLLLRRVAVAAAEAADG